MKTEIEVRARRTHIIEELKAKKYDMINTAIYGQLKKDNPLIRRDWMESTRADMLELYFIAWLLDEKITKEIYALTELKQ